MRPADKDEPKEKWRRTKGQLPVAIITLLLNVLLLFVGGCLLVAVGVYGLTQPNLVDKDPAPPPRAMHFSLVLGVAFLLMALFGVLGHKKKPKQPFIMLHQLLLLLVSATVAACLQMVVETERVLKLFADSGGALPSGERTLLLKLFLQFERAYSFCRPGDHRNALWSDALSSPGDVDVRCVAGSGFTGVGEWARSECLEKRQWSSARLDLLSSCHTALLDDPLSSAGRTEPAARAAWLFCACSDALPAWVEQQAAAPAKLACGLALAGLVLLHALSCLLCCRFKAKKKKPKDGQRKQEGSMLLGGTELPPIAKLNVAALVNHTSAADKQNHLQSTSI